MLAFLQPRIGVRGLDASVYLLTSISLREGRGYQIPNGDPIAYWPPGYSWLLSFSEQPLQASRVINTFALGAATGLLYLLARRAQWDGLPASGLSMAMGLGFFRGMANDTRPDMLTYALFLLGVAFLQGGNPHRRFLGYWIWNLLIPLKLIAAVFTPIALGWEWALGEKGRRLELKSRAATLIGWVIIVGAIGLFNHRLSHHAVPHILNIPEVLRAEVPAVSVPEARITYFLFSVPRSMIAYWHGSIRPLGVFLPFCGILTLGVSCLATLRPRLGGPWLRNLGLTILVAVLFLRGVWYFDVGTRITGYGWLLLLLAFRPTPGSYRRWFLYAGIFSGFSILNMLTTNALGANDPRYERLAQELKAKGLPSQKLLTNSFRILDLHVGYPTWPVRGSPSADEGSWFLKVTLPAYDPVSATVWPVSLDSHWREITSIPGAALFQKTGGGQMGTGRGKDEAIP